MTEITVVYIIGKGCVTQKDRELKTLAAKFNGESTSSSCFIPTGERDIQFVFESAKDAKRFKAESKKVIAGWTNEPAEAATT